MKTASHIDDPSAESEMISLLRAHDQRALELLQQKYGALISRLAFNVLRDRRDAEECANDVMLELWRSFPPQGEVRLGAFVAGVTRHTAIDRYRRNTRKSELPAEMTLPVDELYDELHSPGADEEFFARELGKMISGFLDSVSAKRRRVFVMRYYGFYSAAEIAEKTGVTVSAVDKSLAKTKKALRAYLERNGVKV